MDWNPKTPLEGIFKDNYLARLEIRVAVAARWPPSSKLPVVEHPRPTRSLMVDSVDFDFHHSFLITSALFAASVLAIFYLSHLFALV
jgi:hypothetical protein